MSLTKDRLEYFVESNDKDADADANQHFHCQLLAISVRFVLERETLNREIGHDKPREEENTRKKVKDCHQFFFAVFFGFLRARDISYPLH